MRKQLIMWVGLFATGLVAMSGSEAMAVLNIGGGSLSTTCKCNLTTCIKATHPTCTASIGGGDTYASAPSLEQSETVAAIPDSEPIATFASIPSSEPRMILVGKQTSVCPTPEGYVADSFGDGAGNLDPDHRPAVIELFLQPTLVAFHCMNPAGQDGGLGVPFATSVSLLGSDVLGPDQITGRGKWLAESTYSQSAVCAGLTPPPNACKPNWFVIPNSCEIVTTNLKIEAHRCSDGTSATSCAATPIDPPDDIMILNSSRGTTCDYNSSITFHQNE